MNRNGVFQRLPFVGLTANLYMASVIEFSSTEAVVKGLLGYTDCVNVITDKLIGIHAECDTMIPSPYT